MSNYKRLYLSGRCYFFTVVTAGRKELFADAANIALLRASFRYVMQRRRFQIDAVCVLPDHIHCICMFPHDANHSVRWQMIKTCFTRLYRQQFPEDKSTLWQPRYWEHLIRDEEDLARHLDYIHYNPVKHGLVENVSDWPFSSFQKYRKLGYYDHGWGEYEPESIDSMQLE